METVVTEHYLVVAIATLDQLLKQENVVLEFWTMRKKKLDQCHQFVLFERSAKQVRPSARLSVRLAVYLSVSIYMSLLKVVLSLCLAAWYLFSVCHSMFLCWLCFLSFRLWSGSTTPESSTCQLTQTWVRISARRNLCSRNTTSSRSLPRSVYLLKNTANSRSLPRSVSLLKEHNEYKVTAKVSI